MTETGEKIYNLAAELFPIPRSLTGEGVRETLNILRRELPGLQIKSVPSGTKCFDWTVPKEWNIRDAYIKAPDGSILCDFKKHNLHVVGYSVPVDAEISLEELQEHLYSMPELPEAIPYITSYYKERWGFCIKDSERKKLKPGMYHVKIDSSLTDGVLNYGELLIKGKSDREILVSTYICHPSMANNEVSGPAVSVYTAKSVLENADRNYSYRFVFIPETLGSIVYLSMHYKEMKEKTAAGFILTCIGDDRVYSMLASRDGDTMADAAARHVLKNIDRNYKEYSFLERGSDERQYCSPGIDLPVVNIMRSKYNEYPEYHSSLDDMSVISPQGLSGGLNAVLKCIEAVEKDCRPRITVLCEPQLGKRGLYPTLCSKDSGLRVRNMMNFIAYSDGKRSLIEIAEKIGTPVWELYGYIDSLTDAGLMELD